MEMHLESLVAQTVSLDGHRIPFAAGETIHTENSYKFTETRLRQLLETTGYAIDRLLQDDDNRYAVTLAKAVE